MTTDQHACGLGSILPMSCRGRAEAFARRLQSRLNNLGGHSTDPDGDDDENSWLTPDTHFTTLRQPLYSTSSESDVYYDFDIDSPGSPQEEATEDILLNRADAKILEKDLESGCASSLTATSPGSDSSDGNYYDPEAFEGPVVPPMKAVLEECNGVNEEDFEDGALDKAGAVEEESHEAAEDGDEGNETLIDNNNEEENVSDKKYSEFNGEVRSGDDVETALSSQVESIVIDPEKTKHTFCSTFVLSNQCVIECVAKADMGITTSLLLPVAEEVEDLPSVVVDECKDDTDDDEPPRRVQRCSSLKTGKTPPGTPGRKKIVRFADVLGLDLADVRTFLDEIPKVPTSAYEDLPGADLSLGNSTMSRSVDSLLAGYPTGGAKPERSLVPLFQQPGGSGDFIRKVRSNFVCLENAMVKDMSNCTITGTVRVLNMDFNKSVHVRYTLDGWTTFADLQATYVPNSCDGFSDTFSFVVYGNCLEVGQRIEFAIRYQCRGEQFWDNNNGMNYVFQCLPPPGPAPFLSLSTDTGERWSSFY